MIQSDEVEYFFFKLAKKKHQPKKIRLFHVDPKVKGVKMLGGWWLKRNQVQVSHEKKEALLL